MVSGTALRAGAPPPATHAPAGGLPAPRIVSQKSLRFPCCNRRALQPYRPGLRPRRRASGCSSGVEHNLAKVGVERSNRFTRSSFLQGTKHRKAAVRRGFFVSGACRAKSFGGALSSLPQKSHKITVGNGSRLASLASFNATMEKAMQDISGKRVAILATNGFEQSELEVPLKKLREAGAKVDVVSLASGKIKGWDLKDWGREIPVDKTLDEARAHDYDAIVLPGGVINPDLLRVERKALDFIVLVGQESRRRDLSCALASRRDRHRKGSPGHLLQIDQDRCDQRRRSLGGQQGRRRPGTCYQPQPRRSRRVLRQARRGDQGRAARQKGCCLAFCPDASVGRLRRENRNVFLRRSLPHAPSAAMPDAPARSSCWSRRGGNRAGRAHLICAGRETPRRSIC